MQPAHPGNRARRPEHRPRESSLRADRAPFRRCGRAEDPGPAVRRSPGHGPGRRPLQHLLTASGITNKSLRALMTGLLNTPYGPGQMTYDLRRLRLAGLIRRIGHTNRYLRHRHGRLLHQNRITACSAPSWPPSSPRHPRPPRRPARHRPARRRLHQPRPPRQSRVNLGPIRDSLRDRFALAGAVRRSPPPWLAVIFPAQSLCEA